MKTKVVDLFGVDVAATTGADWKTILLQQQCPFEGKKCFKTRKSQPSISIGTCVVKHGRAATALMICPSRLLERRQIFVDCLHLLHGHSPGNELHVVSETALPGGNVDYCLASVLNGRVKDFVGVELQTLDTTGTVWPERQRLLRGLGFEVQDSDAFSDRPYGINWKMTAKTILVQLHHKVGTFEHLNKHLVLVLQDHLLAYMRREFNFRHLSAARNADPMHFHSYSLADRSRGHRIELAERCSTDEAGIAVGLGLQADSEVAPGVVEAAIEAKLSGATLLNVG